MIYHVMTARGHDADPARANPATPRRAPLPARDGGISRPSIC